MPPPGVGGAGAGPQRFLFVGNPGVGKSSFINALCHQHLFKSGFKVGTGLTTHLQEEMHDGVVYMDTPGLADPEAREQAAKEITAALKKDGMYKVIFVVTTLAGRVSPQDSTTMKLVLESAPISAYAVIVNKLTRKAVRQLEAPAKPGEASNAELFKASIFNGLPIPTPYVHYAEKNDELEDEESGNIDWSQVQLADPLLDFIEKAPSMYISAGKVKPIEIINYERLIDQQAEQMQVFSSDLEALRKANREKDELARQQLEAIARLEQQAKQSYSGKGGTFEFPSPIAEGGIYAFEAGSAPFKAGFRTVARKRNTGGFLGLITAFPHQIRVVTTKGCKFETYFYDATGDGYNLKVTGRAHTVDFRSGNPSVTHFTYNRY